MKLNRLAMGLVLAGVLALSGCGNEPAGVSVHAVNYTEDEIVYILRDPANEKNIAGGEAVVSYGAGGGMCCFVVPSEWTPGTKVLLDLEIWLTSQPKGANGTEVKQEKVILDLPQYDGGKPTDLWVVRNADGSFELIATDFQPDHAKWPGKVKGWPVPSKQYREKLVRRDLEIEYDKLSRFEEVIRRMKKEPLAEASEQWAVTSEHRPQDIEAYSGPSDPKYVAYLRESAEDIVRTSQQNIQRMEKELQ